MKKEKGGEKVPTITVYKIEDWRKWLSRNHLKKKKVGMISYKKHTGKSFIGHHEAMREAIRFGWIDTTINKLDDKRFVRHFVRRGDNANWSRNTLKYAREIIKEGKMSEHGLMRYKQGLKKRPHDHGIPDSPRMPKDLGEILEKDKSREYFDSLAPSYRKMLFRWILRAKLSETRQKRVKIVAGVAKSKGKNKVFPAA